MKRNEKVKRTLYSEIAAFLEENPKYQIWKDLPAPILHAIEKASAESVISLAYSLWASGQPRLMWAAVTVIRRHPGAAKRLRWRELENMGQVMNHWGHVDMFAFLAGTAWREGRISDQRIHKWARSPNRWFRRGALVCTVLLNRKSFGGYGDPQRTLTVCRLLVNDRDDMVVKGMSWALRELINTHSDDVRRFLAEYEVVLAARVLCEVRNKLTTGLKNPPKKTTRTKRGSICIKS